MGTIFAPTYTNLTTGYHEIKVYSIISQSYALVNKHFQISWFRDLGECQILLEINLMKPEHLRSILNQINNIQLLWKKVKQDYLF